MGYYEEKAQNFDWSFAMKELGYIQNQIINIGWYCTDRICNMGKANKIALLWENMKEKRQFTFDEIRIGSNTFASFLQKLGIQEKDRVCLFMDKIPELYIGFLGILKLGAIVQPLFSAFGEESLWVRLQDADTKAIITQKKYVGKIRKILSRLPSLKHIVLVDQEESRLLEKERSFSLEKENPVIEWEVFPTKSESPSVLHYTSGTTGKPKGVKHVHFSLFSQYMTAKWVLDLKENDIYWCSADPGWVTGTSYGIIGPWSLGITQCVLDAGFSSETWYRFLEKYKVSVWYTSPTAIRSLMKAGEKIAKKYDLSALRHLASVGEPLNPEAILWGKKVYGREFLDTYWQTETGSIMISNFPDLKIKPGSMGKPFPGITAALLDQKTFEPFSNPQKIGLIAFKPNWPALMREYWNHPETYEKKFQKGWYLTGDRARKDEDGYFWFVGRDDDIINTAGHLVSPFEVESALLEYHIVAESAVIGKPDEINKEIVKAFIVLKEGYETTEDIELSIMNFIRKKLSPMAMPQSIEFVKSLPKTRSGKIMRRLLRAKEWGEDIGDISSLEND